MEARVLLAHRPEYYLIPPLDALMYTFCDIGVNECHCFPGMFKVGQNGYANNLSKLMWMARYSTIYYTRNSVRSAPFFLAPAVGRWLFGPPQGGLRPPLRGLWPLIMSNNIFSTNFHHHGGWWRHFSKSHLKQQTKTVVLTPWYLL